MVDSSLKFTYCINYRQDTATCWAIVQMFHHDERKDRHAHTMLTSKSLSHHFRMIFQES